MINSPKINESIDFCRTTDACPYLPNKEIRTEYKYIKKCSSQHNDNLIKRGWRRFGRYFFRPVCEGCSECQSISIDVENFKFSRSQRRIKKKNVDTQIIIQAPSISLTHLQLYDKFHKYKEEKNGWKYQQINPNLYHENYIDGKQNFSKEVLYIVDNKVVGIDYIDMIDDGISSIYFFYDPDYNHLSLGTYSLLYQIELAKELGLQWIYLGYYVKECASLNYKAKYTPYTTLQGDPELNESPVWR